jgi:hypothetical protein
MGFISGRFAGWPRGSTSRRSESRPGRRPFASVGVPAEDISATHPGRAGYTAGPGRAFGLAQSRHGRWPGRPRRTAGWLTVATVACRRGQPVPGSWGGRYQTDVRPGTPAGDGQVPPGRSCRMRCAGRSAMAPLPRHQDQARSPLVPVGAPRRVAPPDRPSHTHDTIRTPIRAGRQTPATPPYGWLARTTRSPDAAAEPPWWPPAGSHTAPGRWLAGYQPSISQSQGAD